MLIIPAVDIRGGKCVRLLRGDFGRETVFSGDPVSVARQWTDQGATALHVVDLDGAKQGAPQNIGLVESIVRETGALVDFGGGLRTVADVERAFSAGVAKVNIGTALLGDPAFVRRLVEGYPRKVLAALDCRDGMLLCQGWLNETSFTLLEAARRLMGAGLAEFVYTDVSRDGAMAGPDLEGLGRLLGSGAEVIASGGVASLDDVVALAALEDKGLRGIIIGRALYAGAFTLAGAMAAASGRRM